MLHRSFFGAFARQAFTVGALAFALLLSTDALAQNDEWSRHSSSSVENYPSRSPVQYYADKAVPASDTQGTKFEANNIIAAVLCFTVGFGACFLVIHNMLPELVHRQCTEIVRDHLDSNQSTPDVRVVVLDREQNESIQKPRRISVPVAVDDPVASAYAPQTDFRVDRPIAAPATKSPATATTVGVSDEPQDAMLSQIYQQNVHLRSQLRDQARSIRPTKQKSQSHEGADQ